MTTRTWLRKLFASRTPRTIRKAPARCRPSLEALEDRLVPTNFTVTHLADDGGSAGSLRWAITQANNMPGDDTINFSVTGTINLIRELPFLDSNLAIEGPGAGSLTVRRNSFGDFGIFRVSSGRIVALSGLTIANGSGPGGGIYNFGTLTVSNCTLSDNTTAFFGGGIRNVGTLTVSDSFLLRNSAPAPDLGDRGDGGGIYNEGGTVTISNSLLSFNSANRFGGGIRNVGTLTVSNSTLSGNSVLSLRLGDGGGIYNQSGAVTVSNSTLSGNTADRGGGIRNDGALTVSNSTLSGNSATGLIGGAGGGILNIPMASSFTLNNSIVANSPGGDVVGSFTGSNNLTGTVALGGLSFNGGPTQTHALPAGSPAINAGNNALIPAGVTTDQRGPGFPRIIGNTVDIGAFEAQAPTITRNQAAVTGNEGSPVTNTGTFDDADGRGTVTLTASVGTLTRNDAAGTWAWSHTPPDGPAGPTTVTITATAATDTGGLMATTTFTLTVNNVAPTITAFTVPTTGTEGNPVNLSAAATDPAGAFDPLTYTWTVTRPDGTTLTTLTGASASFTPPDNGNYGVSLTVDDGDGGVTSLAAPGLVSWWRAEGNANDARGGNNGALVGGVTYAPGKVGQAFSLDGTGRVQVADAPNLDLTSAATLEAWISPSTLAFSGGFGEIIAKGSGTARNYGLFVTSTGALHLSYFTTGGTNVILQTAANLVPVGQFSHVAAVIDPGAGVMQIYLNGQLVTSRATAGPLVANTAALTIGSTDAGAFGSRGLIDEPTVYNRALSQIEIQSIVNAGSAGKSPLVAVANVAPTITNITVPAAGAEGSPVTLSATATDPAGAFDPLTYTWTVTRPDGTTLSTLTGASASFTPPDNGNYGVSLTVDDGDGGITSLAAPGLVSWWRAEGNANDARGGNNGALMGGVTYAPGKVGQAFNLDGTGRVQVPDAANLSLTTAATLEAWINPSNLAFSGGFGAVIAKGSGTARNYGLFVTSTGALHLSYFTTGGTNVVLETAANLVPAGQFSHVAAVIDPGAGVMQIYLNGQLVTSRATAGPLVANTAALTIGSTDVGAFGFRGLIDEPTVYNRALSQIEIQSIVNASSAGKSPLVAVANVAPTITSITVPATGAEGSPVTLSATATDPAGAFDPLTYTWTVTRPDGTTLSTLTGASASFTPPDNGSYGVSLTVDDGDGGITSLAAPGLVSWWRGEGSANDARGANNGALVGGVTYAPGKVGQAFNLDGTGRVQVPDAANLSLTTAATLEAWINPSSLAFLNGFGAVLAKGAGTARNYGLFVRSDGGLHLSYFTTGGANVQLDTPANLVPAGQFSHVAATIDPGAGVMQIYLNGQLVTSRATAGPLVANTAALTIGSTDAGAFGFKGLIDEPTVYNRALSPIEIQSIGNAGSAGKSPLVAVANVAPTPTFSGYSTGVATQVLTYTAATTDPSSVDSGVGFAYSINWGDGSPVTTVARTANNGSGVSVSHGFTTAGTYTVALTATDKDGGATPVNRTVTVLALTSANLQTVINQQGSITFQAASGTATSNVVAAVNGLSAQSIPVNVTLNLGGGIFTTDTHVTAPAGVTLVVANGTLIGGSPALIVDSGVVLLHNVTARNSTNAPTIVVTGGHLVLRNNVIEESDGANQAALRITGGTVDLGTPDSPGGNTFNAHGRGELIHNAGARAVSALGNTFQADGVTITSPYRIKDEIFDALNAGGGGLVSFVEGQVFVTASSGSIQRGINAVPSEGTVNVEAGLHGEFAAGSKLLTVSFQNGPTLSQQRDPLYPGQVALVITGTTGNDEIQVEREDGNRYEVEIETGHTEWEGTFSGPVNRIVVHGGAGNDEIEMAGSIRVPAWLYGDAGNDRLHGGAGNNVLLGGAGNDQLIGGRGRNLLIGGLGADRLNAGRGDDLLIGGTTTLDANEAALAAIMAEWTSGRDYATRVANLRGTGSGPRNNGNSFLKVSGPDATVFDDNAVDVLHGGSGMDWFFASLSQDIIHGRRASEIVESL